MGTTIAGELPSVAIGANHIPTRTDVATVIVAMMRFTIHLDRAGCGQWLNIAGSVRSKSLHGNHGRHRPQRAIIESNLSGT